MIGTTWGTGTDDADPSTDFNIPDLRGRFARGVDHGTTGRDEDRATRTESAPGGVTGAAVGTIEADSVGPHAHLTSGVEGSDRNGWGRGRAAGVTYASAVGTTDTNNTAPNSGAETRPENVAVLYIIRL